MSSLKGKSLFITGGSRGIGLAIAKRAAEDGANVTIAAKTTKPHPQLPGTIHSAAEEIENAGGKALAVEMDIRHEEMVKDALAKSADHFGGIDIVINNASAIFLQPTESLEMKRFDLMHQVNARGTFMVSKHALPFLQKAENPHILMLSPPLDMSEKWFAPHVGYSMAKYGMSLVVLGLAGEVKKQNIAVNALWPRTTIATAAIANNFGMDAMKQCRKPEIMADAAHIILSQPSSEITGQFFIDDTLLAQHGCDNFDQYRVDPTKDLIPDFFVPAEDTPPESLKAQKEEE
ncbi:MAG: SDR family oxidoreductase [Rhodomicrobiaceae bacterium]